MSPSTEVLEKSCIVVAHPDDEMLWFSSILSQVDKVIICFNNSASRPKLSKGRKAVIEKLPLADIESLSLTESNCYGSANWSDPAETSYGLKLNNNTAARIKRKYKSNYLDAESILKQRLKGFLNVYTHNPWGEYGHEEHVQIFRAIESCQKELKFNIWCNGYVGTRSHILMARKSHSLTSIHHTRPTDNSLQRTFYSLYAENSAWTWISDMSEWFANESMFRVARSATVIDGPNYLPMNFIGMSPQITNWRDKSLRQLGGAISSRIWPRVKS